MSLAASISNDTKNPPKPVQEICKDYDNNLVKMAQQGFHFRIELNVLWLANESFDFVNTQGDHFSITKSDSTRDFFARKDVQVDATADLREMLSGSFESQLTNGQPAADPGVLTFDWGLQDFYLDQKSCGFVISSEKLTVSHFNGAFYLGTNGVGKSDPQPVVTSTHTGFETKNCAELRANWKNIGVGMGRKFMIHDYLSTENGKTGNIVELKFDGDPADLVYRIKLN